MNDYVIKVGELTDIPEIRFVARMIWEPTYVPILGEAQVEYMLELFYSPLALEQQLVIQGQRFLLAKNGLDLIGFAALSVVDDRHSKLHKLYVLPQYQGKGVAAALLDEVKTNAGLVSAKLYLNVNRYNARAIGFYEKSGFERTGMEDIDIGGGYYMNDYIYTLDLKNSKQR